VVHEFELWAVSRVVEEEFGFTEMQVISFEDLIGGKLLYEIKDLTADLFRTFPSSSGSGLVLIS
jgi:hypothetical protein